MILRVLLPHRVLLEREVRKVCAEGPEGAFGILPRHQDYATILVPGLLSYETHGGEEAFVAHAEGILVKHGSEVLVSTRNAAAGSELGSLGGRLASHFEQLDETERRTRAALAQLEVDLARRLSELGGNRGEV